MRELRTAYHSRSFNEAIIYHEVHMKDLIFTAQYSKGLSGYGFVVNKIGERNTTSVTSPTYAEEEMA